MVIREYHYLDEIGIDSLFSQTSDRAEISLEQSATNKLTTGLSGKAKMKIGEILNYLGIASTDLQIDADLHNESFDSAKIKLALKPENKLKIVIGFLKKNKSLYHELEKAFIETKRTGQPIYVEFTDTFEILSEKSVDPIDEINENQFMQLKLVTEHFLDRKKCDLLMGGSLCKWLHNQPTMSWSERDAKLSTLPKTSHLAIALRSMSEPDTRSKIYVFGKLRLLSNDKDTIKYYIKPFAVSV